MSDVEREQKLLISSVEGYASWVADAEVKASSDAPSLHAEKRVRTWGQRYRDHIDALIAAVRAEALAELTATELDTIQVACDVIELADERVVKMAVNAYRRLRGAPHAD